MERPAEGVRAAAASILGSALNIAARVLEVGPDQIVYKSADPSRTRTWRYEDIDNISSSGPFQLTITTFERTRLDYGSRKQFNFELKQALDQARYTELWLKLEERKGLGVLNGYRQ